jgi:hypothetical protein
MQPAGGPTTYQLKTVVPGPLHRPETLQMV